CATLNVMKSRIPDQRAERKHPDTIGAWCAGEDGLHLCGALGIRHEAHIRPEHAAHQGMHRAVENAFARQSQGRHESHILARTRPPCGPSMSMAKRCSILTLVETRVTRTWLC